MCLIQRLRVHRTLTRNDFGEMQTPLQTVPVQALRNARSGRGIARGRPKIPISLHVLDGRTDANAVPTDSVREGGSASPLRYARWADAPADLASPNTNSNREDN